MIYSHTGFMLKINDVHNHPEYAPICAYLSSKIRVGKVPYITSWKILRSSIISHKFPQRKVPARFLRDEWILLRMIRLWSGFITRVPDRLITPNLALLVAEDNNYAIENIPGHLQTPKIVMRAIKVVPENYLYVAPHLRTKEVMLRVFSHRNYRKGIIEEDDLTEDFLIEAVQLYCVITRIPTSMITPKIAMTAVLRDANNFAYIPRELQTIELCSAAIKQKPKNARYIQNQDTRRKLGIM